jgi:uncharacterized protein with PQ loop repeat
MTDWIGTVASFIMPFFNIPMIFRLLKRKRSDDISLTWVGGVWVCILLMTPKALRSADLAFRLFGISNIIFFSVMAALVFYYRLRVSRAGRD